MDVAFDAFQADDDQWVAILTGAGDRAFCAGNDLKFQAEHGPGSGARAAPGDHRAASAG